MHPALESFTLQPIPGSHIAVDHLPGEAPGWLYLHGLGSVRVGEKSERLMAHARASGRSCTRFDFRGHGDSSGTFGEITLTDKILDAATVLRRVGPSILIGSSMGGLAAAWLAARYRDLVPGLTLVAPALGFLRTLADHNPHGDTVQFPGHDESYVLHRHVLLDAAQYDEATLPARIHCPTLVVHGTADEVIPCAVSERFFDRLRGANKELWLVGGEDHRLNRPFDAILARAERFFTAHGAL
jgi:pimeloyl-ACP methyl ester carboxylesterase